MASSNEAASGPPAGLIESRMRIGGQSLGQPCGGFKQSGPGREFSLDGMLGSFSRRKAVSVDLAG